MVPVYASNSKYVYYNRMATFHTLRSAMVKLYEYSKTSDSEVGAQNNKPLNKGHSSRFPIVLIHF